MKKYKAFTLIELLVVISIIALLLSILMPALGRVKKLAQQTVCLNNVRQNGLALNLYTNDNDDSYIRGHNGWDGLYTVDGPGGDIPSEGMGYWMSDIKPYRGEDIESLVCASAKKPNPDYQANGPNMGGTGDYKGWKDYSAAWNWSIRGVRDDLLPVPVSYTLSAWATNPDKGSVIQQTDAVSGGSFMAPYSYCWKKTSNVRRASSVPLIGDGRWLESYAVSPTSSSATIRFPDSVLTPPETEEEAREAQTGHLSYIWGLGVHVMHRHPGGINMTFADTSARKIKLPELWALKWNKQFDTNNDYVNGNESLPGWIK